MVKEADSSSEEELVLVKPTASDKSKQIKKGESMKDKYRHTIRGFTVSIVVPASIIDNA